MTTCRTLRLLACVAVLSIGSVRTSGGQNSSHSLVITQPYPLTQTSLEAGGP